MLAAGREPAVLLGHREAEPAELGEALDHLLGDVGVLAVDVLGDRPDSVGREAVERLADEVELVAEMRRAGAGRGSCVGDGLEEHRRAVVSTKGSAPSSSPASTPHTRRARRDAARDVSDRVGDEQRGELRLVLAVLGVLEHDPGRLDAARRVREVVGEDLGAVERGAADPPAVAAGVVREPPPSRVDHRGGVVQRGRRSRPRR